MAELKPHLMLNREMSWIPCYLKSEADEVLAELKSDYEEACGRLQTANLIKDEQKEKADKLLSCLKSLVMSDLIKECTEKASVSKL